MGSELKEPTATELLVKDGRRLSYIDKRRLVVYGDHTIDKVGSCN